MVINKKLWSLVIGLFTINLLIISFLVYNFWTSQNLDKTLLRNKENKTEVLGEKSKIPIFDKSNFLSPEDFTSNRACGSQDKVQKILEKYNSPLSTYTERNKPASYWIYASARGLESSKGGYVPQLNPCLILAYLQKEQSLLTLSNYDTLNDPNGRIRKAMGYACPDTKACDPQYSGFVNQVTKASWQLWYNYSLSQNKNQSIPYIQGRTIATLDGFNVYLTNSAVAANYRYTPHVCWGNYNLWKWMNIGDWMSVSKGTFSSTQIDSQNRICFDGTENKTTASINYGLTLVDVNSILQTKYQIGYKGKEITTLQKFLKQELYYTREITDVYGTEVHKSAANYRIDNKIIYSDSDYDSKICDPLVATTFNSGDSGEKVLELQKCLSSIGLFAWENVTSYFGPVTQRGQETARKIISGDTTSQPKSVNLPNIQNSQNSQNLGVHKTTSKGVNISYLRLRDNACGKELARISWGSEVVKIKEMGTKSCFGYKGVWSQIEYKGKKYFVADYYLAKKITTKDVSNTAQTKVTVSRGVKVSGLKLRNSACGTQISTIPWNTKVAYYGKSATKSCFGGKWNWVQVSYNGRTGWVADYYLK
jgi:hypothetical protein